MVRRLSRPKQCVEFPTQTRMLGADTLPKAFILLIRGFEIGIDIGTMSQVIGNRPIDLFEAEPRKTLSDALWRESFTEAMHDRVQGHARALHPVAAFALFNVCVVHQCPEPARIFLPALYRRGTAKANLGLLFPLPSRGKARYSLPRRRRMWPGGRTGLQNRVAWRKLRGWFDSIPSPPVPFSRSALRQEAVREAERCPANPT